MSVCVFPIAPADLRAQGYMTARMTRASFSKISAICASLTINGGAIAMVSPPTRITRSSSWNARSMAS